MAEMKDSGIEWIGEIPDNWDINRFKYIYSIQKAKLPNVLYDEKQENMEPYMTMEYIRDEKNVIPQYTNQGIHCNKEDILILWDGSNAGEIIYNHPVGRAPSTTAILTIKHDFNEGYTKFYLKFLEEKLRENTNGMGIPHVDALFLKNLPFLIPNKNEQKLIADFLNDKVGKIDDILIDFNKQIETLEEYKKSIITEAVTKGLDPDVEMKDSGIEWIGNIPKNWNVDKIKYHLKRNEPKNPGNVEVLSVYREYGVIPKNSRDDNHNITSEDTSKYKYVKKGDLVINKMKAWQGSMGVSEYEGIVSPAYFIYNFTDNYLDKKYFHFLIRNCYKDEFRRISGGIREGQWDLSADLFAKESVLIPPIKEQIKIVEYLNTKCAEIDGVIVDKKKQLETLEEYKKSLIYEYVTGKKEVLDNE